MINIDKLIKALGEGISSRRKKTVESGLSKVLPPRWKHLYSPTAGYGKNLAGEEALIETGTIFATDANGKFVLDAEGKGVVTKRGEPFVYAGDLTCSYCKEKVPNESIEIESNKAGGPCYFTAEHIELHTLEKHQNLVQRESRDIKGAKGRQIDFFTIKYSTEEGVTGTTRLDRWACWLNLEDVV